MSTTRSASDTDGQVNGQARVTAPHDEHAEGGHQTGHAGKARVVGVMIAHRSSIASIAKEES